MATTAGTAGAYKAIRFFKENSGAPLKFTRAADSGRDSRLGVYTDASRAARPDTLSQDGHYAFVVGQGRLDGEAQPLTCLDWGPRKPPQARRSNLSAESQACATAADRLGRRVNMPAGAFTPRLTAGPPDACNFIAHHAIVADPRGLHVAVLGGRLGDSEQARGH